MSRMNRFNFRFSLGAVLTLALVGLIASAPTNADIWPGLDEQRCMADAYGGKLNCTANDVEITKVNPIDGDGDRATLPDGTPNPAYDAVECVSGSTFQLNADLTIRTNANERWDTTFYMPLNDKSPMDLQNDEPNCSLAVPDPGDILTEVDPDGYTQPAYSDLDSDECGDITKALGPDQYTLYDEQITMYCKPSPDDPTRALFTYCAAWDNQTGDNCYADVNYTSPNGYYGQVPSQKSKCKCDAFAIDVFIKPEPPIINKKLVGVGTHTEFGGDYTFELSFTNTSESAAVYIQALTDEVDIDGDGTWDDTLDLLDADAVVIPPAPAQDGSTDGVYLKDNSECIAAYLATDIDGEVLAKADFKCEFTVHIIDTQLPLKDPQDPTNGSDPELYDDAIKVLLWDKNDNPVTNGEESQKPCTDIGITPAPGEYCSNELTVEVTNLLPGIEVTKTAIGQESLTNSITEPGEWVDFTVTVKNPKTVERLMLTELHDLQSDGTDLDLNGMGTCATGDWIAPGDTYTCTFPYYVEGNAADDPKIDTVTATLKDNENNTATDTADATLTITDTPSVIVLDKVARESADPTSQIVTHLNEPGDWVYYHYTVTNISTVDTVYIDSLVEDIRINGTWTAYDVDLTVDPDGIAGPGYTTCDVDPAVELLPNGGKYHCVYYTKVTGNAGDKRYNLATASGKDDDGKDVSDDDDHEITIDNVEPAAHLTKDVTKMLVTYQVEVFNDSAVEELFIDVLNDDTFGDITSVQGDITRTTCALSPDHNPGSGIAIGGSYTCEFDAIVTTSPHTDTVTGTVADDDGFLVYPNDSATVSFE